MKTKSFAVRKPRGSASRSSHNLQTKHERAKSSARLLKPLRQPDGGLLKFFSKPFFCFTTCWLGACCADRCAWLSRAFRLGRRGCPLRTVGSARCCRSQEDSARQNLLVCLPPAVPHCGKDAAL